MQSSNIACICRSSAFEELREVEQGIEFLNEGIRNVRTTGNVSIKDFSYMVDELALLKEQRKQLLTKLHF